MRWNVLVLMYGLEDLDTPTGKPVIGADAWEPKWALRNGLPDGIWDVLPDVSGEENSEEKLLPEVMENVCVLLDGNGRAVTDMTIADSKKPTAKVTDFMVQG